MKARKCDVCKRPTLSTTGTCAECLARYDRIYSTHAGKASPAQAENKAQLNQPQQETTTMKNTASTAKNTAKNTAKKAPQPVVETVVDETEVAEPGFAAGFPAGGEDVADPVDVTDDDEEPGPGLLAELASAQQAAAAAKKPFNPKEYIKEYNARMKQLPAAKRAAQKLRTAVSRLAAIVEVIYGWTPETDVAGNDSLDQARALLALVEKLPDDFTPPKKAGTAQAGLPEGARVDLVEKIASKYDDVIDPEERKGLTVLRSAAGKVVVRTIAGTKMILPRGHVAIAK